MRGVGIAVFALLAAVACGSAGATPSGDEARKRPALSIVSVDPLTVKGKRFVAHERVKLLVGSPAPRMKAAQADARGRFTARFKIVTDGPGIVIQAIGSRGSRAMIDITALDRAPLG
jgi:hypothetical protein